MTDKAIQARAELKAWVEKYQPELDEDYSGCWYPEDKPSIRVTIDDTIIASVYGSGITIQGE